MSGHAIKGDVHSVGEAQASLAAAEPAFGDLAASMNVFLSGLDQGGIDGDAVTLAAAIQGHYTALAAQAAECAAEFGHLFEIQRSRIPDDMRRAMQDTWFRDS